MMRVLLIYLGRRGGGAIYSLEVAKALQRRCELTAVVSAQALNLQEWKATDIDLIEVPTYENSVGLIASTFNLLKQDALVKRIKRLLPDVLYYPMVHFWTPLINIRLLHVPKVVTIHDPILHKGERNLILRLLQEASMRQATRVILLSNVFAGVLRERGIPESKIDIIPHGEFSYYLRKSAARRAVVNKEKSILFFGRISPYKGIEVLLEAYPLIKSRVPETRLLIVGSGDMSPYQNLVKKLEGIIVVNRWIADEEVAGFFERASLVVLPYVEATQSGVIPIAYAFGLPVVATRTGGIPEQVIDGVTGLLVPPGDRKTLADACVRLLLNDDERNKMGRTGQKLAMTKWNWDLVTEMVYQSCVKAIAATKA